MTILAILSVTHFLSRLIVGYVSLGLSRASGFPISLLRNLTATLVYALGLLIVLDYLKISITPLITALGVGGLAVALALQDTLSNLFAGIHILATRKVRSGDYIKLESGEEGYVRDITWRNTAIEVLAGNLVIVPNNKVASAIVTNFDLPAQAMGPSSWRSASDTTDRPETGVGKAPCRNGDRRRWARSREGSRASLPYVRFHTFGEGGVVGTVILRARAFADQVPDQARVPGPPPRTLLPEGEGSSFPVPARTVVLRKDEEGGAP